MILFDGNKYFELFNTEGVLHFKIEVSKATEYICLEIKELEDLLNNLMAMIPGLDMGLLRGASGRGRDSPEALPRRPQSGCLRFPTTASLPGPRILRLIPGSE